MSETNWLPGILALSAGLIIAALYLLLGRRRPAVAESEVEGDTQRRVDSLLRQLQEHQAERHQMEASAWAAEQERLERLAAEAMRARDSASAVSTPATSGARPVRSCCSTGATAASVRRSWTCPRSWIGCRLTAWSRCASTSRPI